MAAKKIDVKSLKKLLLGIEEKVDFLYICGQLKDRSERKKTFSEIIDRAKKLVAKVEEMREE